MVSREYYYFLDGIQSCQSKKCYRQSKKYWKFSLSVTFWKFQVFGISVQFFFWALSPFQVTASRMKKVSELEAFILSCSVKSYRLAPLYLATFSGRWK